MPTQFTTSTSYSDEQMLALVRQAIAEVLVTGQSYALPGGRQFTRASLTELRGMESDYLQRIDLASSGMVSNYARFSR